MALFKLGPTSRPKKRSLKLALAETLLALFLVSGAAFGLASCTIETGTGGATTTTGLPLSTVSTVQSSTTSNPSAGETAGGGLASPAEPVAAKLGPSVVNVAVSGTIAGVFGRQQYSAEGSGVIYRS
ncbi:MAG: hypothetical protein H5T84_03135, partial [Thermoleophilia bacterium]|nr:hypothetical protein [Thermoleophilia bacterium]